MKVFAIMSSQGDFMSVWADRDDAEKEAGILRENAKKDEKDFSCDPTEYFIVAKELGGNIHLEVVTPLGLLEAYTVDECLTTDDISEDKIIDLDGFYPGIKVYFTPKDLLGSTQADDMIAWIEYHKDEGGAPAIHTLAYVDDQDDPAGDIDNKVPQKTAKLLATWQAEYKKYFTDMEQMPAAKVISAAEEIVRIKKFHDVLLNSGTTHGWMVTEEHASIFLEKEVTLPQIADAVWEALDTKKTGDTYYKNITYCLNRYAVSLLS